MPSACEVDFTTSSACTHPISKQASKRLSLTEQRFQQQSEWIIYSMSNSSNKSFCDAEIGRHPSWRPRSARTQWHADGRTITGPVTIARAYERRRSFDEYCATCARARSQQSADRSGHVMVEVLDHLNHVIFDGFRRHSTMSRSHTGPAVAEALSRYKGWRTFHHNRARDLPPIPSTI